MTHTLVATTKDLVTHGWVAACSCGTVSRGVSIAAARSAHRAHVKDALHAGDVRRAR